jgi:Holliday junction resolvase
MNQSQCEIEDRGAAALRARSRGSSRNDIVAVKNRREEERRARIALEFGLA